MTPVGIDIWMETVRSLTVVQAAFVLSRLRQGYTQEFISLYKGDSQLEGSFAWIAAYELTLHTWYDVTCKFVGGPDGKTEFMGTVGMFVADRLLREVSAGRESMIWDAYREVYQKDSDDERVRIPVRG